ncbi:MAG: hypothetical protein V4503_06045 [Gemmatimonadota bacterium]
MTNHTRPEFLQGVRDFGASLREDHGRLLWTTILVSLAACGTSADAKVALNVPTIDTLPGGIVHVVNTGPTAWPDTSGWRWVPTVTISPPDGSPGELSDISTLAIGDDGTVYAMQNKPAVIKVFGPDGSYLGNLGKEGGGPGEYHVGFLGIRGDTLGVQDPNSSRFTLFLKDGTFLKAVPSPCCYFWPRITIDSTGLAWIPGSGRNNQASWYRIRLDGSVVDTIPMPAQEDFRKLKNWTVTVKRGGNAMSMIMMAPLQPGNFFEPRIDGMIVSGHSASYRFAILRGATDTARLFEASAPELPISDAMRDTLFENATQHPDAAIQKAMRESANKDDIPHTWLPWTHLSLDRAGRLWVALPGDAGEVTRLQVFDRNGILLGDVPPPSRKMFKSAAWGRDRLAVADEDDDGRPVIRVFRLETGTAK